jgi:hypothetical protein
MSDGRDDKGQFSTGNNYGQGRPPRAVERDYLAALSERLSLDDWRSIVDRAVKDARSGDARARDWLSRYALGSEPMSLTALAIRELMQVSTEAELAAMIERETTPPDERLLDEAVRGSSLLKAARDKVIGWDG